MKEQRRCFAVLVVLITASSTLNAEGKPREELKPLSTRTRCIVKYRECIVLIAMKDADAIFPNIADGDGKDTFKIYPTRDSLSRNFQNQLKDVERFFKFNFRNIPAQYGNFDKMRFSDLQTANERVKTTNMATGTESQAKLHVIHVKIPGIDAPEYSVLRFVEVDDRIYWIPTEW